MKKAKLLLIILYLFIIQTLYGNDNHLKLTAKKKSENSMNGGLGAHLSFLYLGGVNAITSGIGIGTVKPISNRMNVYGGIELYLPVTVKSSLVGTAYSMFTNPQTIAIPVTLQYKLYRFYVNGHYHVFHEVGDDFSVYALLGFGITFARTKNTRDSYDTGKYSSESFSDGGVVAKFCGNLGAGAEYKAGPVFLFSNFQYGIPFNHEKLSPGLVDITNVMNLVAGLRYQF